MGQNNRARDLTSGSPFRLVIGFAAPLLVGLFFQQLYSFVDAAIVGRTLGSEALAAVGATGALNFMVIGLCTGMCSGFAIPIAQCMGARQESRLRRYVFHAALLSGVIALVTAAATALLCPVFLGWMNTPADILEDSARYIRLIFLGIPATVLYNMASGILRSLGDSRTPVRFLIMASLINIALDLFFILALRTGVAGAALATVISQAAAGIGCLLSMRRGFPVLRFEQGEKQFSWKMARELVATGLPMGLQYSITAIGSVMVQSAVNVLGTVYVASVAAAGKLSMFFACIFDALSATMATFAGQNTGARDLDRVKQGLRAASLIGTVYCVLAFLVIWLGGRWLLLLFVQAEETAVLNNAHYFLMINGAFYIPLLFVNILRLSIQGMGYTRLAVCAGVSEMIARAAVGSFLIPRFGFTAACFANPAAWIFADLFLVPAIRYVFRQLRVRLQTGGLEKDEEEPVRRKLLRAS